MRYEAREFYLKSRQEMEELFKGARGVTNTFAVAEMCEVELPFGDNNYPVFSMPPEIKSEVVDNIAYLKRLCVEGLKERYDSDYREEGKRSEDAEDEARVLSERIDYELGVIAKTGFNDYFLIVADFMKWAREQGIPVGPGRGSRQVAWWLRSRNYGHRSLRFGLLFERFLNPERVSPPDFDIDFCMRRRGEVIEYVREKYGRDCVANIITFGTFGAKMVVRDVARVRDLPYAEADKLAKMVPDDLNISLEDALAKSPEFASEYEKNPVAKQIVDTGKVIEGMVQRGDPCRRGHHCRSALKELVPLWPRTGS